MDDNKVSFEHIPQYRNNVSTLGSLVLDMRDKLGPNAYINLTDVVDYQWLARDAIAALYEFASPSQISSDTSLRSYLTAIRGLLAYCNEKALPNDFRMMDITSEFLLEYRTHLQLNFVQFTSGCRRRRFGNLLRLLQAGQAVGLAHQDFTPPRNFRAIKNKNVTQSYTASEALDFEHACRTHIREIFDRLEKGKALLTIGRDPRGCPNNRDPITGRIMRVSPENRPWIQLENILWYIVTVLDGKYLNRKQLLAGHSTLNNVFMGRLPSPYRKLVVYSHLYPLMMDLIPFIILLAKKTGRNESSILKLKRDCLQEFDGRYILWYVKKRGGNRRYKKIIDNDGPFSPVALIKMLKQITEPLVRYASPCDQECLFLGLTIYGHGSEPVKSPDASYIKDQTNRDGGWCDVRKLLNEQGRPLRVSLRRWRVFYLTNRYKSIGQLSKISRDAGHALGNTTVDYLSNDATKHIHEQAVRNAQQEARSLARPSVVFTDVPQNVATVLAVDTTTAERILSGEQDVLFATCEDFYNRPGGQPNTPCDKPLGCFICSNAIITRHVLPRVVALSNFIQKARKELSNEDWHAKFGETWDVLIYDVFPQFPREVIAEAERLAQDLVLYIPIDLRT